jgi:hypothetical protein
MVSEVTFSTPSLRRPLWKVTTTALGGVGNSGMGKYHGCWGFEAFTNARGVLYHSGIFDPGVRYPPYRITNSSGRSNQRLP